MCRTVVFVSLVRRWDADRCLHSMDQPCGGALAEATICRALLFSVFNLINPRVGTSEIDILRSKLGCGGFGRSLDSDAIGRKFAHSVARVFPAGFCQLCMWKLGLSQLENSCLDFNVVEFAHCCSVLANMVLGARFVGTLKSSNISHGEGFVAGLPHHASACDVGSTPGDGVLRERRLLCCQVPGASADCSGCCFGSP